MMCTRVARIGSGGYEPEAQKLIVKVGFDVGVVE